MKRNGSTCHHGGDLVFKNVKIKDGNKGKKVKRSTDGGAPNPRDPFARNQRWFSKKRMPQEPMKPLD